MDLRFLTFALGEFAATRTVYWGQGKGPRVLGPMRFACESIAIVWPVPSGSLRVLDGKE